MCGIAGVISLNSRLSEKDMDHGRAMTSILRHRGPDATDHSFDEFCFLGNTRLKIIDLSDSANLPMKNKDGSVVLAYNGEVTNFKELIKEFHLDEKYDFRTTSDTEVVLHLYEELGIKFLDHLSGMFAFALYDKRIQKVYVVRDQFGIRPLFYMQKNGRFYFASEIKSFLRLDSFSPDIDYEAIYHYFSLIYIPGHHTPFKDIIELDGGHYLEIDIRNGTSNLVEYYFLDYQTEHDMTEKEACDGFYEVMLDSFGRNLISDVPLGLTLSGGIDTSSLLSMAKVLGKSQDIHTFSLKVNEASFDESRFQRIMVDYAKPIHHEVVVNPEDILENFVVQMAYLDEPNGNGGNIPSFLLAKEARKYVAVLLSGEGGDELCNAYDTHLAYKIRKLYRRLTPSLLRKLIYSVSHILPVSYEKLSFDFLAKRFTEGAELGIPEAHLYWRHVFSDEEKKNLLNPPYAGHPPTDSIFSDVFHSLPFDDDLNRISLLDFKYFFICDLMVKNDRTFMAHSVEARFPFVDRKVFDFASKIPPKYRIKGFTARHVQKEAMRPILPNRIYRRKSMGLELPHSLWFFNGLEHIAEKYFSREFIQRAEIFNYDTIQRMWQEHIQRRRDNGRALWSVLNYLLWFDLYVYNNNFHKYLSHN